MELLHISLHLRLWEFKRQHLYIGMKIHLQGEFYGNAYPTLTPSPPKAFPVCSFPTSPSPHLHPSIDKKKNKKKMAVCDLHNLSALLIHV